MFSRRSTRRQYLTALALRLGIPFALFALAFFVIGITNAIGAGYIWFFLGLPLLLMWTYAVLVWDTSARTRDAGLPLLLAPILATMLLGSIMPTLQFHWHWIAAASVACFAFIGSLPSAEPGREPQFGWMGFMALTCFMELAILALIAIVKYAALMRSDMETFRALNSYFSVALLLMPIAASTLIALLAILWFRSVGATEPGGVRR